MPKTLKQKREEAEANKTKYLALSVDERIKLVGERIKRLGGKSKRELARLHILKNNPDSTSTSKRKKRGKKESKPVPLS